MHFHPAAYKQYVAMEFDLRNHLQLRFPMLNELCELLLDIHQNNPLLFRIDQFQLVLWRKKRIYLEKFIDDRQIVFINILNTFAFSQ